MSTKLSMLCDRVIEAGWLLALIVTPLFFNVYSSWTFEPDKVTTLRSLALIMALAWLVKGLDTWRGGSAVAERAPGKPCKGPSPPDQPRRWPWLITNPFPLLALLVLGDYAGATAMSIAPRLSLWGAYERLQGLYTTAAYVVVFFSVLALLRQREQVERLLTTILLVSLPVSLYGILQHFGADPVPWDRDATHLVQSTMGHHSFVAAFLGMTIPLALYRLLESAGGLVETAGTGSKGPLCIGSLLTLVLQLAAWWVSPTIGSLAAVAALGLWFIAAAGLGKLRLPCVRLCSYNVLLATQLACMVFTQGRGAWLGLLAGLCVFALLWTVVQGKWGWSLVITGGSIMVIVALVGINLPHSPLRFVHDLPYVGRLSRVFDSPGRVLIWQGTTQLITAEPRRFVLGYGPETMHIAYPRYFPPALGQFEPRDAAIDRAHNETLDTLVTTGLIGLTLSLSLFTSLFYRGLTYLGLIRTPWQRRVFLGLWLMGGMGAVWLSYLVSHAWHFFGVALPLGMLAGMGVYVSGYGVWGFLVRHQPAQKPADKSLHLLVTGLLSAIVVHFVETQFGIAVAATRLSFWTYAALLVVAGRVYGRGSTVSEEAAVVVQGIPTPSGTLRDARARSRQRCRLMAASLLGSCIMLTLAYDFLFLQVNRTHVSTILWLLACTWVFGGLIIITETGSAGPSAPRLPGMLEAGGAYAGITLLGLLLYAAVHQGWLRQGHDLVLYYALLLLTLVATSGVLLRGAQWPTRTCTRVVGLISPAFAAVVLSLMFTTNINVVRANVDFKQAKHSLHRLGQYDRAIELCRRALELEPTQDVYYSLLAKAVLEKATRASRPQEREALFREAQRSLLRAQALNPLEAGHAANLARLYHIWAQHTGAAAPRATRWQNSLAAYAQATTLSPHNVLLWNEWGATYAFMGDAAPALEKYRRSLALDDTFAPTYLHVGELYHAQGKWAEAAQAYEQAIVRQPDSVRGHSALGAVYTQMGRLAEAVRQNHRVLDLEPNDLVSHRNLALLYRAMGQIQRALVYAQRVLEIVPSSERQAVENFIAQLRQQLANPGD